MRPDSKTLNASKQHYHKKSTDFGFAVKQRQTEVKSDYRKHADKLDADITSLVMRRRSSPF
jgi:macrodomain Ter protein organizer (MatP/YcbG family)